MEKMKFVGYFTGGKIPHRSYGFQDRTRWCDFLNRLICSAQTKMEIYSLLYIYIYYILLLWLYPIYYHYYYNNHIIHWIGGRSEELEVIRAGEDIKYLGRSKACN